VFVFVISLGFSGKTHQDERYVARREDAAVETDVAAGYG
jgi:hypothetical protein